jgi:phenylacetate-coenzyme A ligase PaaK-like adenylate-forming protein
VQHDAQAWERLARLPAPELKALSNRNLARFVREELYPFSRHYRRVFDVAGVGPESLRTVADLRRLPFTTKQDLLAAQSDPDRRLDFVLRPEPATIKAHWPFPRKLALVLGGARAKEALRYAYTPNFATFTTGRSSDPVLFTYTPHDLDVLGEATARMYDLMQVGGPTERVINAMPFAPHLAFWAVTIGGFASGTMVLPTGGGKTVGTDGNLRLLERMRGTAIVGTPGFVYHLLRTARERGSKLASVRRVALGAEKVPSGLKAKMQEHLQACGAGEVKIMGTYGFTEARMAWGECPTGPEESSGYHLYPDLGVFEVVDPSGEPVAEGADGELVYTGISGHGTVVCRYRTGDRVIGGLTWEPCPWCGRTLPRIASTLRRVSEQHALNLTKIKGTLVDLSHMGTLLSEMRGVEEWQIVISKKNDDPLELDQLEVRVAPRGDAPREYLEQAIARELLQATEVAPNKISFHSLGEMLEFLGLETQTKESRYLDRRPK